MLREANAEGGAPGTVSVRAKPTRAPWWRRVPSLRRLVLFSLFSYALAAVSLVGGVVYIRNIVPLTAEIGDGNNPIDTIKTFTEHPGRLAFRGRDRINLLVLGIDYNYTMEGIHYTKGARSDTLFVVSLDPDAEFLNVLSIPRDTQVFISEEHGTDKINGAFAAGGIEQAMETVSEFLGVPVDHYLILKVDGARALIDALGGLPIEVEKDMDYDDNWGRLHIHLKKGPQVLTGEQAVGYARFRMDEEGDRGRIRRQQQVIRALVDKLHDPAVITRLDEIAQIVKDNVETDLQILEMVDLANLYDGFDQGMIRGESIVGDDAETEGVSYIIPYAPENERIVRRLLKDPAWLAVEELRVRVVNGSRDPRGARKLAEHLKRQGFQVVHVEDTGQQEYERTQVIHHVKIPRARGLIAAVLPGADFQEDLAAGPEEGDFDLTIIAGNDTEGLQAGEAEPAELRLEPTSYPVWPPRSPDTGFEPSQPAAEQPLRDEPREPAAAARPRPPAGAPSAGGEPGEPSGARPPSSEAAEPPLEAPEAPVPAPTPLQPDEALPLE
ncbi:MAG: LCP family protein [Armatimonadetes bacterium]|nr:LCP family protein [Armatimonadota bacterium]